MDKNKDLIDEILAGNGENDPEVLEMISENCKVLSEEQKNRILGIIREKEQGEEIQDEGTSADNEEKDLSVVEYRKNGIIKIFAGLAACVCLAAGIKMLGDRNEQFIPSGDDSVKTTTVTEAETTDVTTGENAVSGSSETAPVKETAVVTLTGVTENAVSVPETGTAAVNRMQETELKTDNNTVPDKDYGSTPEDNKAAELKTENTESVIYSETEAYKEAETENSAGSEKTNQQDYLTVYKSDLDMICYVDNPNFVAHQNLVYILHDLNDDGIPELIVGYLNVRGENLIEFYDVNGVSFMFEDESHLWLKGEVTFFEDLNTGQLCIECLDNGTGTIISVRADSAPAKGWLYETDALRDYEYGDDYSKFREAASEKFVIADVPFGAIKSPKSSSWLGHEKLQEWENIHYYFD
ncbi:MAG: hypothetical protein IKH71_10760 [Oscillospiraceae bacterium]|nr:hypothetical protein [Oscillospiraceae bacterium]MBR6834878.1 hypothetical protein [Oscillospiraceae bacterium]